MIETMFPTLASNLGMIHNNPDRTLGRTGNRMARLAVSPYNVYACKDGWFAIICTNEEHWRSLCAAMGRPELADDPRFVTNAARVTHMEETDAMVEVWAVALSRDELFATTGAHRVPSAAVRDLYKVLNNAQMRVRGMLEEIDHPQQGRITVPGGPLRYQGTPQTRATPSPGIGQDDVEVYCELPGLTADDVEALRREGAL